MKFQHDEVNSTQEVLESIAYKILHWQALAEAIL